MVKGGILWQRGGKAECTPPLDPGQASLPADPQVPGLVPRADGCVHVWVPGTFSCLHSYGRAGAETCGLNP